MPEPAHIAVLAPNWLGDALMALPAIGEIRNANPSARLTVAARRSVADVFDMVPDVNGVLRLEWDGRWWWCIPFLADARRLQSLEADLVVLLPNSFATAMLAWCAGIPEQLGYARDGRSWLMTQPVELPGPLLHQSEYYRYLVGAHEVASPPMLLTVPKDIVEIGRQLLIGEGWDGRRDLVILAPGAAYGTAKQWTLTHAVTLTTRLVRERDVTCVLVGSGKDGVATAAIVSAVDGVDLDRVIDLAGRTTLTELTGVFACARALVTNDSGAMHVAAGVGMPVVALFGPTNEAATAPLVVGSSHVQVLTEDVSCRPCMLRNCPIDHRCMTRLLPERVLAAVDVALRVETTP
jgi:heptosyltransferase-2